MAKIPTYTADNLASARTPVPEPDNSGVQLGKDIANFSANVYDVLKAKQELVDKLAVDTARTDVQTAYMQKQHAILTSPDTNSRNIDTLLQSAWMETKNGTLGAIQDGSVRQSAGMVLQQDENQVRIDTLKAKQQLQDQEVVNSIFNNSTKLISAVSDVGDPEKIAGTFQTLDANAPTLMPFMKNDAANVQKYIQNTKDELVRQFVAKGISSGREDQIDQAYVLGKFDGASPNVKEQISKDITTALETKQYRADLTTAFQVVNDNLTNYKDLRDGAKSFADIEHLLSQESYKLESGSFSDKQKQDIQGRITFLKSMRTAQLQQSYIRSRDDLETKTQMEIKVSQLLDNYDGTKELHPGVYLDQIKSFQDELTKAFVDDKKISGKTYNTLYSEALGTLYNGFTEDTFKKSGWESLVGIINKDTIPGPLKSMVAQDSRLPILRIHDALKKTDKTVEPKIVVAAFQEYLDDKGSGIRDMSIFTPQMAQEYAMKAKLKLAGYPGAYQVGDPIVVRGRSFTIGGFKNGEVLLQTDDETARHVATYTKQPKTTRH